MVPFCWLFTGVDGSGLLPHFFMSTGDRTLLGDVDYGYIRDGAVGLTDEMVIGGLFDNILKCLM
jgi:hypothetical protein